MITSRKVGKHHPGAPGGLKVVDAEDEIMITLNKCPLSQAKGRRKRVQKKPVASDGARSSLPHHAGPEAWAALGLWGLFEAGDHQFTLRLALPWSPQDGRMEDSGDRSKNKEHLK